MHMHISVISSVVSLLQLASTAAGPCTSWQTSRLLQLQHMPGWLHSAGCILQGRLIAVLQLESHQSRYTVSAPPAWTESAPPLTSIDQTPNYSTFNDASGLGHRRRVYRDLIEVPLCLTVANLGLQLFASHGAAAMYVG